MRSSWSNIKLMRLRSPVRWRAPRRNAATRSSRLAKSTFARIVRLIWPQRRSIKLRLGEYGAARTPQSDHSAPPAIAARPSLCGTGSRRMVPHRSTSHRRNGSPRLCTRYSPPRNVDGPGRRVRPRVASLPTRRLARESSDLGPGPRLPGSGPGPALTQYEPLNEPAQGEMSMCDLCRSHRTEADGATEGPVPRPVLANLGLRSSRFKVSALLIADSHDSVENPWQMLPTRLEAGKWFGIERYPSTFEPPARLGLHRSSETQAVPWPVNRSGEHFWARRFWVWSRSRRPRKGSRTERNFPEKHSRIKELAIARSNPTFPTPLTKCADLWPSGFMAGP